MKKSVIAVSADKSLLKLLEKELERPDLTHQSLPPAEAEEAIRDIAFAASGKEAAELLEKKTNPKDQHKKE